MVLPVESMENKFKNNPIEYPYDYYTNHSMGCMLLSECKVDVVEIKSIEDLENYYGIEIDIETDEFDIILTLLDKIGSKVFIASEVYFPASHRGVYHTSTNNFYLNDAFMHRSSNLISVMRHEGWHAAQDCMAGTIENDSIAIILPQEDVPLFWRELVERTYPKKTHPWESEAVWAGKTKGMTIKALQACSRGEMWKEYKPTPLTKKYLIKEGFIE